MNKKTVLYIVNCPAFFLSHRLSLALEARKNGYEVHVATGSGSSITQISELGFQHHILPLSRSGMNPFQELILILKIQCIIRAVRPFLVHLVTIKPVIYGGIIARLAGVPATVAAVSGLGTIFIDQRRFASFLRVVILGLIRVALNRDTAHVIFQNDEDRNVLVGAAAVQVKNTSLIKGSGVSLLDCKYLPEPQGTPIVVFAGRLLRDKGIFEFVEAANILSSAGVRCRFIVAGSLDDGSSTSLNAISLRDIKRNDSISFIGHCDDIPELFSRSHLVVLPSYREGFPKVLMEAAACGRAAVTTDVPGCRSAVIDGKTGLLVPPRNAAALADAISFLISNPQKRAAMGHVARLLAEREFSIERVVQEHMKIYSNMAANFYNS